MTRGTRWKALIKAMCQHTADTAEHTLIIALSNIKMTLNQNGTDLGVTKVG
jgi:hypothetical protein